MNKGFALSLIAVLSLSAFLFRPMTAERVDKALKVCERLNQGHKTKAHALGIYAIECIDTAAIKKQSQVKPDSVFKFSSLQPDSKHKLFIASTIFGGPNIKNMHSSKEVTLSNNSSLLILPKINFGSFGLQSVTV